MVFRDAIPVGLFLNAGVNYPTRFKAATLN
jgi:hypothetical protein